jgi:hypothetical protein
LPYEARLRSAYLVVSKTKKGWKTRIANIQFAPDSDGDWIADELDNCPSSPMGAKVNRFGCLDHDNDGIEDDRDNCPETPKNCQVNSTGCHTDSDNDSVCDNLDRCPGTPTGAIVDSAGCPWDDDNDGVYNGIDKNNHTPVGCIVDSVGCQIDSDNDGVCDGLDKCDTISPNCKIDVNGCTMDSDNDGICDGVDRCRGTWRGYRVNKYGCYKSYGYFGFNYMVSGSPWDDSFYKKIGISYYGNSRNPLGFFISGLSINLDSIPDVYYTESDIRNAMEEIERDSSHYEVLVFNSEKGNTLAFNLGFYFRPFRDTPFLGNFHIIIGSGVYLGSAWERYTGDLFPYLIPNDRNGISYAVNKKTVNSSGLITGLAFVIKGIQVEYMYNFLFENHSFNVGLNIPF